MEYLRDGDTIKLASWKHNYATVRVRGAYAVKSTSIITSDPNHAARHREAVSGARIVAIGETVSIDGKPYTVSVPRGNEKEAVNSDPIHFHPAPQAI